VKRTNKTYSRLGLGGENIEVIVADLTALEKIASQKQSKVDLSRA